MKDVFARFDFDLAENANWYVQGSWAQAENTSDWIHWVVSPSASRPNTLFANNPFLTPATQQLLGSGIVCWNSGARRAGCCLPATPATSPQTGSTPPPPPTQNVRFSAPSYIWNNVGGEHVNGSPNRLYRTSRRPEDLECGNRSHRIAGRFRMGRVYNHGNSELTVTNPNNTDNAKYLAALDAVNDGGTISAGSPPSRSSPASIPGCVPTNITDPARAFGGGLQLPAHADLVDPHAGARRCRLLDRRRSLGLWAPRRRNHGQPVGRRALGHVRHGERFPSDRLRQLHGPAHVSRQRRLRRCAGCRTPMRKSMPRTTSTKSRWN